MCIIFLSFDMCYMIVPCYLHKIYIFGSFAVYENDIVEVISNLQVQGSKCGVKKIQIWRKIFLKIELCGFHGFVYSKSEGRFTTINKRKEKLTIKWLTRTKNLINFSFETHLQQISESLRYGRVASKRKRKTFSKKKINSKFACVLCQVGCPMLLVICHLTTTLCNFHG